MTISIQKGLRGHLTEYLAFIDGEKAGELILTQTNEAALGLYVTPKHRRKGVATALYDFAEADLGKPLVAAPNRSTDEQKLFREAWEAKRQKQ